MLGLITVLTCCKERIGRMVGRHEADFNRGASLGSLVDGEPGKAGQLPHFMTFQLQTRDGCYTCQSKPYFWTFIRIIGSSRAVVSPARLFSHCPFLEPQSFGGMLMLAVVAFQQSQGNVCSHKAAISRATIVCGAMSAVRVTLITFGPICD
jgi:hypothetical protein